MSAEVGAGFVLLCSLPVFSVADESKTVRSVGYGGYDENIHTAEAQFCAAAPYWASTMVVTALLFAIGEVLPLVEVSACAGDVTRATDALLEAVRTMATVTKAAGEVAVEAAVPSQQLPESSSADALSAKGNTLLTLFGRLRMLLSTVRDAAAGNAENASGPEIDTPIGDGAGWTQLLREALADLGADATWAAAAVRSCSFLMQNAATAAQDTARTTKKPYNATTASAKELDTFAADVLETVWLNSVPALYDAVVRLLLQGAGLATATGAFAIVGATLPRLALSEAAAKAHAQLHQLKRDFIQSLVLSDSDRDEVLTTAFTEGDGVVATAVHGSHWVLDMLPFPLVIADAAAAVGKPAVKDDDENAAAAAGDLVSKHDATVRAALRAALLRTLPRLEGLCPTAGDAATAVRPSISQFGLAEGLAPEQLPDTVVFPVPRGLVTRLVAALAPSAPASDPIATALANGVAIAGVALATDGSVDAAKRLDDARCIVRAARAWAAAQVSPASADATVSPAQTDAALANGANNNDNNGRYPVSNALSVIPYLSRGNILLQKFVLSNLEVADSTTGVPLYVPRIALQLLNQVFVGAAFVPLEACKVRADLQERHIGLLEKRITKADAALKLELARGEGHEKHAEALLQIARSWDVWASEMKDQHAAALRIKDAATAKVQDENAVLQAKLLELTASHATVIGKLDAHKDVIAELKAENAALKAHNASTPAKDTHTDAIAELKAENAALRAQNALTLAKVVAAVTAVTTEAMGIHPDSRQ
jgi:hypothetical protein